MDERVVVFLDLLGFSKYVEDNPQGALQLIEDYSTQVTQSIEDNKLHPVDAYSHVGLKKIAERTMITSFMHFLPMSDSIFIVSDNASLLVHQLSHFLVNCFALRQAAFAYGRSHGDPRNVVVRGFYCGDSAHTTHCEVWYPLLFRGAIACGNVNLLRIPSVTDATMARTSNLVGPAVVDAVRLEGEGTRGPRLLCTEEFVARLDQEAALYVGECIDADKPEVREIYWPLAYFETEADVHAGLQNGLNEPLRAAVNLWKYFLNSTVSDHYYALIRLLIKSTCKKYPSRINEVKNFAADVMRDEEVVEKICDF